MSAYPVSWLAISLTTFFLQVAIGTDLAFAGTVLLTFLLLPPVYTQFRRLDSIGAYLLVTTFSKLLIVSQWLKIAFLQPAESHLDEPLETVLVLLSSLAAFAMAGLLLRPCLKERHIQLFKPSHDPRFMLRTGLAALILALTAIFMRHHLGMDKLADPDALSSEEMRGQGMVLWNYFAVLLPFAVAILTARCMILSQGRRPLDLYTASSIVLCLTAGLWSNNRTEMFLGPVSFYVTYLVYGGRVRFLHIIAVLVAAIITQIVIFPLIDIQRTILPGLTYAEYFQDTMDLLSDMMDADRREQLYSQYLKTMYEGWSSRQYYGSPQGMIDRFSPSQVDEVVSHVTDNGRFGLEYLFYPVTRLIPPVLLGKFGLEHPLMGGRLLEVNIWGHDRFSYPNYSVISEIYSYVGFWAFPLSCTIILFIFFFIIHYIYGGLKNNYFGAFCVSIYFFTLADGDLSEIVGRTLEQVIVYIIPYQLARLAWSGRGASSTS